MLGLLVFEGASVGLGIWTLLIRRQLTDYVTSNLIAAGSRAAALVSMGAGVLAALGGVGLLLFLKRPADRVELGYLAARRSAPLCLAGLVPLLFHRALWDGNDLAYLALVAGFVLGLRALAELSLDTPPVFEGQSHLLAPLRALVARMSAYPRGPLFTVAAATLLYMAFFAFYTIRFHHNLGTASFDLGAKDNLIWNLTHGGPLFKMSPLGGPTASYSGHHQPYFAYLVGLPYMLVPRPETLLVVQAALMGAAALPLFLLARRQLSPWKAAFIAILYLFYPPLHCANLYDFHFVPLATVFLWASLYLIGRRQAPSDRLAILTVVLAMSVREDVLVLVIFLGIYLVLSGRRPSAGLLLCGVAGAVFVILKGFVMPTFLGGASSFTYRYRELLPEGESGFSGVIQTVIANPGFTIKKVLEPAKLVYLLQIITPLAFLPWRRPIGLLCTLPGLLLTLLSTGYPPLIQLGFQYTTYWTVFLFPAVVDILGTLDVRRQRAWLWALAAAMLITTHHYGAFLTHDRVHAGFGMYRFTHTEQDRSRRADLHALIALVPPLAKIVSSEMVVPHVSSRPDSYTLRVGVFDAEYLLIQAPARAGERPVVADALKTGEFGVVAVRGDFTLARRGASPEMNAQVLDRLGL